MCSCRCRAKRVSELERVLNTALDWLPLSCLKIPWKGYLWTVIWILIFPIKLILKKIQDCGCNFVWSEGSKVKYVLWLPIQNTLLLAMALGPWWEIWGLLVEIPNDKHFGVLDCLGISDAQLTICKYSRTQETEIWNVSCPSTLDKQDSACDKIDWQVGQEKEEQMFG